jgi:uncharacterized lipoprotein YmbA
MKMFNALAVATVTLLTAGCSTTSPSQYYSLASSAVKAPIEDTSATQANPDKRFVISVQPVTVPRQVDRPQIVLSTPGSPQVVPLNGSLWASPLSEEIRNALANDLSRQLGVLDIASNALPASLGVWRISLDVQRFESAYEEGVALDVTWQLTPVNLRGRSPMVCGAQVHVPVASGMQSLVAGHQQALHEVATVIAAQLMRKSIASDSKLQLKGCTTGAPR